MKKVNFDEYSKNYDDIMQKQHKKFGDIKYYAEYKIKILSDIVKRRNQKLKILEYGCGTGRNLPYIVEAFRESSVFGFDISKESLEIARQNNKEVKIIETNEELACYNGYFDVIFIAGVYHHIEPSLRDYVTSNVFKLAADNCNVAVFEHNPYNPLTRRMVSTCEFDKDAVLLSKKELQSIFFKAGFKDNGSAYTLFFPPILKSLSFFGEIFKMASAWRSILYCGKEIGLMRYDISLLKYLLVGVINTIFGYAIIFTLLYFGAIAEISNFIGYFVSIFISFYLNKYFSFNDDSKNKIQIFKFIISMGTSYVSNLAIMSFSYRFLSVNAYISQILGGFGYICIGYLLSKNWVFCRQAKVAR